VTALSDCFICSTIEASDQGRNPAFIAKLRSGYLVLNDQRQYYAGYAIFQSKRCVRELHELPRRLKMDFLKDMTLVSEAMWQTLTPAKLNYALLGNTVPHLHWSFRATRTIPSRRSRCGRTLSSWHLNTRRPGSPQPRSRPSSSR